MKHLELFSGIGGFRRAMDLLTKDNVMHFTCVGFSEIDSRAVATYKANFNISVDEVEIGDIVSFTREKRKIIALPKFDLLTGGFPCQTFSIMGSKAGFEEERGLMFFRILDIIITKKPKYVLLENVKHLRSHNKGKTYMRIRSELEQAGYKVYMDIFNTADFHLPQTRNRVLIFATRVKIPAGFEFSSEKVARDFDKVFGSTSVLHYNGVNELLKHTVEKKYYLSDKIKPTILADGSANFRSKSDINMKIARPLTASMHKMHRACQDNYYSQDFIDSYGKVNPVEENMSKEELCRLHIRKLTPEEAFMLQGFPEDYAKRGRESGVSDVALYKQAGNAVSVNTIYATLLYLINNKVITDKKYE